MVHNLQHYLCGVFKVFFIKWMWAKGCAALSFAYLPKDQCGGLMNMSAVIHLPLCFPIHAFVFIFSYPFISLKEFLSLFSVGVLVPCLCNFIFIFIFLNVLLHFIQF
jgi:hypothetical protein